MSESEGVSTLQSARRIDEHRLKEAVKRVHTHFDGWGRTNRLLSVTLRMCVFFYVSYDWLELAILNHICLDTFM